MKAKRKSARMGRPPKARKDKRLKRVFLNMTIAEFNTISADAKEQGFASLSDFFLNPWRSKSQS